VVRLAAFGARDVTITDEGRLRGFGAEWVQVGPLTFQERFGSRTLIFREDEAGSITHAFLSSAPYMAMERVPLADAPGLNLVVLILGLGSVGLALLLPILAWAMRWWYGIVLDDLDRIPRTARGSLTLAAILFAAGTGIVVVVMSSGDLPDSPLSVAGFGLGLLLLAVLPTLVAAVSAIRMWMKGDGRFTIRIAYTVAALSFCLFLWQLNNWNLLGWKF